VDKLHDDALLSCLRSRRNPAALEAIRPLLTDPGFDWAGLLDLAAAHRVSALLGDALEGTGLAPAEATAALREAANRAAFRNLYLFHELGQQLERLKRAGIDVLALKGAGLAVTAYRTIALRPMVDVDLLARRDQVPALLDALVADGYQRAVEPRPGAALEFENEIPVYKAGLEPVRFDVHWSLFDSLYYQANLSLDWFWESARVQTWQGFAVPVPGPEAQLIHLCGHLALHHAQAPALLWLNDLVEVLWANRGAIQWNVLLEKAAEMELVLPLQNCLGEAATTWDAPIPPDALARLQALPVSPAEERVFHRHAGKQVRSLSSRVLPDLAELPPGQRLRFIWTKLAPSPEYMRDRYQDRDAPLPLLYLYHFGAGARAATTIAATAAVGAVKRLLNFGRAGQGG
jgi:hypothetical protein